MKGLLEKCFERNRRRSLLTAKVQPSVTNCLKKMSSSSRRFQWFWPLNFRSVYFFELWAAVSFKLELLFSLRDLSSNLTDLFPIHLISTPWKHQKIIFWCFQGGGSRERVHWEQMGQQWRQSSTSFVAWKSQLILLELIEINFSMLLVLVE